MAANNQKKTTTKSTGSTAKKSSASSKKTAPKEQEQPKSIRRELVAFLLVVLGVFTFLGFFGAKAVVLRFFVDLQRGLFGTGFYILPFLYGMIAFMLFGSGDKPVLARSLLTAGLAVVLGALVEVLLHGAPDAWSFRILVDLYENGVAGPAGGLFSGLLGAALAACLSSVGAVILLILLFLCCLMAPLRITPRTLIMAIHNRPRPENAVKREEVDMAEKIVNHIAETQIARAEERSARIEARRRTREEFNVDVPVDDPPLLPKPADMEKKQLPEGHQLTMDELPDQPQKVEPPKAEETEPAVPAAAGAQKKPEDVMPLPLITDLIEKNRAVPKRGEAPARPQPVSVAGPVVVSEPVSSPSNMPVFHPEDYHTPEPVEPSPDCPAFAQVFDEPAAEPDAAEIAAFRDARTAGQVRDVVRVAMTRDPDESDAEEELPMEEVEDSDFEDLTLTEEAAPAPAPAAPATAAPAESKKNAGKLTAMEQAELNDELSESADAEVPSYYYPPPELLNPVRGGNVDATEEMRLNTERLADTISSFGVQARIVNVTRGPTVTRYELLLDPGVKLSKITNLSADIALSLGVTGVRISAIPEKNSVVGIEVPNRSVSTVYVREVIDSEEFRSSASKISFAVGKDIGGKRIIGNIAKLPHLLIAGTTGSGKSVCMNSLIISLLYKSSPEDVRLIMIDPKMVELGIYNGIPHLLIPVVTDPKKASGSLQWAVAEMMRRYTIMSESGVRDIFSYNEVIKGNPERRKLPQIVVVIDELADLMLVAAKEVEESICRVAQMGRAAGVHLVVATQRPSSDVITGLMKSNIPSRIAFAVASAMESRIILDAGGAEKLVGRGDMLYAPLGGGKAKRIQGCFITDEEVQRVVNFVKKGGQAEYSREIMEQIERKAAESGKNGGNTVTAEHEPEDDRDELLYDAVDVILDLGQASVSVLQRKLKLGYSRASRIVDQMEEMGIVGPHKGSKPRDILITREKWQAVRDGLEHLNEPVPDAID